MGKKKDYQLNGQLCFDFNTNTEHYVVQSNELLEGKQNLKQKNPRAGKLSRVKTKNFCGVRQNILIFEPKNPFFETIRRLGLQ